MSSKAEQLLKARRAFTHYIVAMYLDRGLPVLGPTEDTLESLHALIEEAHAEEVELIATMKPAEFRMALPGVWARLAMAELMEAELVRRAQAAGEPVTLRPGADLFLTELLKAAQP